MHWCIKSVWNCSKENEFEDTNVVVNWKILLTMKHRQKETTVEKAQHRKLNSNLTENTVELRCSGRATSSCSISSSIWIISWVRVTQSFVFYLMFCRSLYVFILLVIVLSVLLYTMSGYPFENLQSFLLNSIPCRGMFTTTWHKVCKWLMTGEWFSLSSSDSNTHYNWLLQYNWNIVEGHKKYPLTILLYYELHTWKPAGTVMIFLFNSQ